MRRLSGSAKEPTSIVRGRPTVGGIFQCAGGRRAMRQGSRRPRCIRVRPRNGADRRETSAEKRRALFPGRRGATARLARFFPATRNLAGPGLAAVSLWLPRRRPLPGPLEGWRGRAKPAGGEFSWCLGVGEVEVDDERAVVTRFEPVLAPVETSTGPPDQRS